MLESVEPGPSYNLAAVTGEQVNWIWDEVEPLLRSALEKSPEGVGTGTIKEQVRNGMEQLWMAIAPSRGDIVGVAVTYIYDTDVERICQIRIVAGKEARLWIEFYWKIEEWAKSHGCTLMRYIGRKGWSRLLPEIGFKEYAVACAKRID